MTIMPSLQGNNKLVAVAVDKEKGSHAALNWALDTVCHQGQRILLIHVQLKPPGTSLPPVPKLNEISQNRNAFDDLDSQTRDFLLPFRVICSRKDIYSQEIVLEDENVSKALIEFVKMSAIDVLVLGAAPRSYFRSKSKDTPIHTLKGVPDFCSVYIIAKGKVSNSKPALRVAPPANAFRAQMLHQSSGRSSSGYSFTSATSRVGSPTPRFGACDSTQMRSPFGNRKGSNGKVHEYSPAQESDISFVSSKKPTESSTPAYFSTLEDPPQRAPRHSTELNKRSSRSKHRARRSNATSRSRNSSLSSFDDDSSFMSQNVEDVESEMQRLKEELKRKMEMYNSVLAAKHKTFELHKVDESEKARNKASTPSIGYRRYTSEEIVDATERFSESRKIGEGVNGPVYKCTLDHTDVAVKVLRQDANQGESHFQQEVEVLTHIRHPNMVLLLGACPEYGCLVYEHMSNGSLEDHLMQRGKFPPLSWQHRFQIAAEISSSLLFLHHTKPEPIVHGYLKPKSILLDRNLVSKLSNIGLARLVPPSVVNSVSQYSGVTTGYLDPEYQQTGNLSVKSDVYSLGIVLLQLLTSRPPMGLAYHIRRAIESGGLVQILDPAVPDWPVEEALCLANIALQCCELRRIDRPDLAQVMPELERLRELSEKS